jgi:hypothetical protein
MERHLKRCRKYQKKKLDIIDIRRRYRKEEKNDDFKKFGSCTGDLKLTFLSGMNKWRRKNEGIYQCLQQPFALLRS